MSNSKFEYVKAFEIHTELLKNTYIVIRIDGGGFTQFCEKHGFTKPNDIRGIKLMNLSALQVVSQFNEIFMAYGQSDEYSFVFKRNAKVYNRRAEKILSYVVSAFTSAYVFNWTKIFTDTELKCPPFFDGRVILYPSLQNLRDYFSWRQVDCHINNLYNTTFWSLVLIGKMSNKEAHNKLKGTFSKDKNEILFNDFNINYNHIEDVYKKGTIIFREAVNNEENLKLKSKNKKIINTMTNEADLNEDLNFDKIDLNLGQKNHEKDILIDLTDILLRKDEKFFQLLSPYYDQNIFLSHEDIIKDDFWNKFKYE